MFLMNFKWTCSERVYKITFKSLFFTSQILNFFSNSVSMHYSVNEVKYIAWKQILTLKYQNYIYSWNIFLKYKMFYDIIENKIQMIFFFAQSRTTILWRRCTQMFGLKRTAVVQSVKGTALFGYLKLYRKQWGEAVILFLKEGSK